MKNNCLFVVGPPGSGKDFLVRTILMDASEVSLDKLCHCIAEHQELEPVSAGMPLIVNGNADDMAVILLSKEILEKVGYKTGLIYVYASNEASYARNETRLRNGSKTVSEALRAEKYAAAIESIPVLQEAFELFLLFDNSRDLKSLNESDQAEVEGWLAELQDAITEYFTPTLDEEFQEFCESLDVNITQEPAKFREFKNSAQRYKAHAEKSSLPVKKPARPVITGPTREEVDISQGSIVDSGKEPGKKKGKINKAFTKMAKPPGTEEDPRMGDGMAATSTLGIGE